MRRFLSGITLLFGFMFLLIAGSDVLAQGGDEAEYIGARECSACHRDLGRPHQESAHALALFEADDDEFIVADFDAGEDVRTLPAGDTASPFTLEDVAFVIGRGIYAQRFVTELDDERLVVLPAQWNVSAEAWEPYGDAENWPDDPQFDFTENCVGCHVTGLDLERGRWEEEGVQCEACHGPGSTHADIVDEAGRTIEDEEYEMLRAAIVRSPDAQICGQCHVRGTSADGHPYPVNYRPGDDLLGEEGFTPYLAEDDDVHFWPTGHAHESNMQFNELLLSAHASAFETMSRSSAAADECLTCHSGDYRAREALRQRYDDGDLEGPVPEALTLETAQMGITCINCHSPHADEDLEPALLLDEPYAICTTCHTDTDITPALHHPVQQMFEGTAMVEGVEPVASTHFGEEEGPRCVTCHMVQLPVDGGTRSTHLLQPVMPEDAAEGQPSSCSGCHTDLTPADLQSLIEDLQRSVGDRLSLARTRLTTLDPEQMEDRSHYDDVALAIAFIQNDGSLGVHNYAYVDALLDYAEQSLSELSVAGASLEPTEGPAPTDIPDEPAVFIRPGPELEHSGFRPMTLVVIVTGGLVLLASAFILFRRPSK